MRARLAIGVGCTRGTPRDVLSASIDAVLAQHALARDAVHTIASIDSKRDEAGLLALAHASGWALRFYGAASLAAVAVARPSQVVQEKVGTPAVAEPAAILSAAGGALCVPKTVFSADGHVVTLAIAVMEADRDD